jgi:hypothetical protein
MANKVSKRNEDKLMAYLEKMASSPIEKPYSAPEGKTRVTFIIKEVTVEKVKAIAVKEGWGIGDLVDDTLEKFITDYEKKHGDVKTLPPKRKKK